MAATMQHAAPPPPPASTPASSAATANGATNPQLKRIVYSKYRELLGSYNGKANAIIETLPAYMVREDRGFHCEPNSTATAAAAKTIISLPATAQPTRRLATETARTTTLITPPAGAAPTNGDCTAAALLRQVAAAAAAAAAAQGERVSELYGGSAAQGGYEAPACVQNAMVTKDKKPFTYTPGGIDLSQIKSERMAKRLARNAQAEGATGASQLNRPVQPQSPGSGNAASQIGAAGMGMPFQVLPPPPPPAPATAAGKKLNGTSAPPPPPPPSSFSTLAPPQNGAGPGSAPGSPNAQRKSPTPQRFEPPPMGFRPEIKIPPNPMAALRKVPPPVEKNFFWKDEYVRDRSKSPMVGENDRATSPNNGNGAAANVGSAANDGYGEHAHVSLNSNNNNVNNNDVNENVDGYKKPATTNQKPELNYSSNNSTQSPQQQQPTPTQSTYSPTYQSLQQQQQPQYNSNATPPLSASTPPQPQQQQQSPRPEFRSVAPPQSPAVNVYTRQTDSPRADAGIQPQRATESPFRYGGQQQQPQQRAAPAISPLVQQPQQQSPKSFTSSPTAAAVAGAQSAATNNSPNSQPSAQTVPWRTQRTPTQQQQQPQSSVIYNNVSPQQQQPLTQQAPAYQGPKPTNVGSLYIAPLAAPAEPQAPGVVRQFQQQQQQQQQRESPVRQIPQQQAPPQQQQSQPMRSTVPWMSSKPKMSEQPEWVRPEENGNVVPSSLHRIKSPPPPATMAAQQSQQHQQQQPTHHQQQQQPTYQQQQPQSQLYGYPTEQANSGFATATPTNYGSHGVGNTGLRLQINANPISAPTQQTGPRERIIPIQLEQTPTNASQQPNFNVSYGGVVTAPGSYVVRSPNQFVDQGYNNYPPSAGAQQRGVSPTQQLNAPRIVQQQQQYANNNAGAGANRSRIIPIAMESGGEGTRGPISPSPIVLQNDPRSSPIQSKSFRILQKITDTIDDGNGDDKRAESTLDAEPQLQRPQYARQMSAQQARQQPNVEQMRRMHITPDPQQQQQSQTPQAWNQGKALKSTQLHTIYNNFNDMPQPYVHPSEQQVPEPKKYTGSAIPSRSFKILQAMTTPENAAELAASDCVELNENPLQANENHSKITDTKKSIENNVNKYDEDTSEITNTSTPYMPCTTSSSSSISSLSSDSCSHYIPKHPYPAYGYPYPYPWYPPPPMPSANGEAFPPWPYAYHMPPPPTNNDLTGNAAYPTHPPPPYPYYYPFYPPNPSATQTTSPAYPYMHPPPPQNINEFDSQNVKYDSNASAYPAYMPPYPYPYPVAPSYSQSTSSSRASSILPDIIVTPSTDDMPSQVILQHHIKVEKSKPPERNDAVEIKEIATSGNALKANAMRRAQREGSVIDILTQRLEDMSKVVEHNLNMSKDVEKNYAGERDKEFGEKSPTDNASPVPAQIVTLASETEVSSDGASSSDEEEDSDETPKCVETTGLQAIKSVTNIQVYKNRQSHIIETDDEDDVTTADGESDIFDEEDNEEVVEELELDECIEENDDMDYDNLSVIYEEDSDLERSSDKPNTIICREGSSVSDATTVEKEAHVEQQIEENDNNDDEEEDSTSVTVRLPLKFSFNDENVATVEVGKSQIEEKRHSISSEGRRNSFVVADLKHDSDDETVEAQEYDDDFEVSVTISLSGSSRSGSMERKPDKRRVSAAYPIEEIPTPEPVCDIVGSSSEDVSVSFSLNMRNKFMDQTVKNDVINNIAEVKKELENDSKMAVVKEPAKSKNDICEVKETVTQVVPSDDLDFFATLRATKLQAQKMLEQSANYWGKSVEKQQPTTESVKEETPIAAKVQADETEVEDIWAGRDEDDLPLPVPKLKLPGALADAKDDFWSTFTAATKKTHEQIDEDVIVVEKAEKSNRARSETVATVVAEVEDAEEEVDFWAEIEKSKQNSKPTAETKTKSSEMLRKVINEVTYGPKAMKSATEVMSTVLRAEVSTAVDEKLEVETSESEEDNSEEHEEVVREEANIVETTTDQKVEEKEQEEEVEEDFWASVEKVKASMATAKQTTPSTKENVHVEEEIDYWANIDRSKQTAEKTPTTYDPTLYPEEPREVDTDEEIDFWAEIEAKKNHTDDVNFYNAASFWAKQERHNSIDETPYTKVVPKSFAATLPDEPTVDLGLWASLEAAKGAEPEYIDPVVEEEKRLAAQFNEIPVEEEETEAETETWEVASLHEPVVANVWEPPMEMNEFSKPYQDLEQWIHNDDNEETMATVVADNTKIKTTDDAEEANVKRNNYRKAMAFFTTSIDEQKEASAERQVRRGRSSNRNSLIESGNMKTNEQENIENAVNNYYTTTVTQSATTGKSLGVGNISKKSSLEKVTPSTVRGKSVDVDMAHNKANTEIPALHTEPTDANAERSATPTNFEQNLPEVYVEPIVEKKLSPNGLPDLGLKKEENKISVRDRISAFETGAVETPVSKKSDINIHSLSVERCTPKGTLSRNSSQRSESEMEEDDSGVTDMNKPLSETDTESESFPELRKMSSYQRAATHSRLFKLLQDDNDPLDDDKLSRELADELQFKPSRRKIVHNVSITRRQNPNALVEAETLSQRRERLSLPLRKNTSIDADNPSTPNSPASPIMGQPANSRSVSDKLVNELVQSLLLKRDSSHLRQMPMEKLQAAAKRVLEEELDSLENTSVETTPAPTPSDMKADKSYADYYDTWSKANGRTDTLPPPKAYRAATDATRRSPWSVRCPRVLSSKTINSDLARVTESPEIFTRNSKSPDYLSQSREGSVSRWRKV
ncbi:uncharacterized protein LOC129247120 isoform X2 [Anastrepha obliqua]|uniref:uncharacterized protein LOC129247120 isoform X2 n=1 Tax=Anastrepha obliqua TaxID=95512 RepID=UPI00240A998D|nr:uncharacterized protein LOC129247120 isoform X2 [Anastrepha obliqua]